MVAVKSTKPDANRVEDTVFVTKRALWKTATVFHLAWDDVKGPGILAPMLSQCFVCLFLKMAVFWSSSYGLYKIYSKAYSVTP